MKIDFSFLVNDSEFIAKVKEINSEEEIFHSIEAFREIMISELSLLYSTLPEETRKKMPPEEEYVQQFIDFKLEQFGVDKKKYIQ